MNSVQPKIKSVDIVPVGTQSQSWDLLSKVTNTYNMISSDGLIFELFDQKSLDPNIHKFPTFFFNIVIIQNPEICKEIFASYRQSDDGFLSTDKNTFTDFIKTVFPNISLEQNIFTCSEINSIKYHRYLVSKFSVQNLNQLRPNIQSVIDTILKDWETKEEIDLSKETSILTSSIIGKVFLGYNGSDKDPQAISYDELTQAINVIFTQLGLGKKITDITRRILFWKLFWDPKHDEEVKKVQEATEIIQNVINQLMETPNSIFSEMKRMVDKNSERIFNDNEIISMILSLLLAGQDTTANLLNYILMELAKNPQIQDDLQDNVISIDDILVEGLRMFCPASLVGRYLKHNVNIVLNYHDGIQKSFYISANSLLTPAPAFMARNPTVISKNLNQEINDLNKFNPYRWQDPNLTRPSFQNLPWLPLGSGKHRCVGSFLAEMESKMFLEAITKKYFISTTNEDELVQRTSFVNRVEGDLRIKFIPKHPKLNS